MKQEDYLNFILFSGDVTTWKDNLVQATPENIEQARTFVKNIREQGSKMGGKGRRILPHPLASPSSSFVPWGGDFAELSPAEPSLRVPGGGSQA